MSFSSIFLLRPLRPFLPRHPLLPSLAIPASRLSFLSHICGNLPPLIFLASPCLPVFLFCRIFAATPLSFFILCFITYIPSETQKNTQKMHRTLAYMKKI